MNNKIGSLLKNFSYSIVSNFLTLAITTIIILIAPKIIGVTEYGYWQLYLFFSSYVGIFYFGWLDGIYLRYGGYEYDELDRPLFFSQFVEIVVMHLVIASLICLYAVTISDPNRQFIFFMIAFDLIAFNLSQFFIFILQSTNRIKEFSFVNTSGRIFYFVIVVALIIFKVPGFELYVVADILGRLFALVYGLYLCKDLVFVGFDKFKFYFEEVKENIQVGFKLLVANFAGILVIGVVRYGIQSNWSVGIFGKISLTLSLSNFLMTFITSIGIVLYPMLRRVAPSKLNEIYYALLKTVDVILLLMLFAYFPIYLILPKWLPQYADSLKYMAILFPMIVYNGKFSLLTVTFMKTFRFEKSLLYVNVISVIFSLLFTGVFAYWLHNLNIMMLSVTIVLFLQNTIGEYVLSKRIGVHISKQILLESMVIIAFIASNWYLNILWGLLIFTVAYILYLLVNKNQIKSGISELKVLMK